MEDVMHDDVNDPIDPDIDRATDELHPFVYRALAGLGLLLVVAAWVFFDRGGYTASNLAVVSGLVLMLIAIPTALARAGRASSPPEANGVSPSKFRDWLAGSFDTSQGRRKSVEASIEILLPLTAAVIGMVAIGIIFDLARASAP
jgi:hypothetical protein